MCNIGTGMAAGKANKNQLPYMACRHFVPGMLMTPLPRAVKEYQDQARLGHTRSPQHLMQHTRHLLIPLGPGPAAPVAPAPLLWHLARGAAELQNHATELAPLHAPRPAPASASAWFVAAAAASHSVGHRTPVAAPAARTAAAAARPHRIRQAPFLELLFRGACLPMRAPAAAAAQRTWAPPGSTHSPALPAR